MKNVILMSFRFSTNNFVNLYKGNTFYQIISLDGLLILLKFFCTFQQLCYSLDMCVWYPVDHWCRMESSNNQANTWKKIKFNAENRGITDHNESNQLGLSQILPWKFVSMLAIGWWFSPLSSTILEQNTTI